MKICSKNCLNGFLFDVEKKQCELGKCMTWYENNQGYKYYGWLITLPMTKYGDWK